MCDKRRRAYCCVSECLNNSSIPALSLFRLPTDQERRLRWLRLIDREDLINKTQAKHVVCEAHFHPEDINKNSARKLLKKNRLPSLNLPKLKYTDKYTQTETTSATSYSAQGDTELNSGDDITDHESYPTSSSHKTKLCKREQSQEDHNFGIQCSVCHGDIIGFRYSCVQCADCELCGACEARRAHREHYVLRIPGGRPQWEVCEVLRRVRAQLGEALVGTSVPVEFDEPEIRIKIEIQEEEAPSDPLQEERVDAPPDDVTPGAAVTSPARAVAPSDRHCPTLGVPSARAAAKRRCSAASGAHTPAAHTSGAHTSGANTSAVNSSGAHAFGAHTSGTHTSGAHTSAAHISGAHTPAGLEPRGTGAVVTTQAAGNSPGVTSQAGAQDSVMQVYTHSALPPSSAAGGHTDEGTKKKKLTKKKS